MSSLLLNGIIKDIPKIRQELYRGASFFSTIEKILKDEVNYTFGKDGRNQINFDSIGDVRLPFFSMGQINTTHLLGIDELIIFAFYLANKRNYKKVADIGANIGLHTIILLKLGYEVSSFEPDPQHCAQFEVNMVENSVDNAFKLNRVAVSDMDGTVGFTRLNDNSTGSHIAGAKRAYGDLEQFNVDCVQFAKILRQNDLIKADVEGHEAVLLKSTVAADWTSSDALFEIGSYENAQQIYDHMNIIGVSIFPQKIGWRKALSVYDLPAHHTEGSVFISMRSEMNWS